MFLIFAIIAAVVTIALAALVVFADGMSDAPGSAGLSPVPVLAVGATITAALLALWYFGDRISWVRSASAQYINGPAAPVTAGQFCAEMRGWVGMQRAGHTLRSVQCSGGGHEFTVHIRID